MLPRFPRLQALVERRLIDYMQARMRGLDPILDVQHTRQHEGTRREFGQVDGATKAAFKYRKYAAPLSIPSVTFDAITIPELFRLMDDVAHKMASQVAGDAYDTLSKAADDVGNAIDAQGAPFTFDMFTEMLERIQVDFDEATGAPIMPAMISTGASATMMNAKLRQWLTIPANEARLSALLEAKREQWRARETRRALVD